MYEKTHQKLAPVSVFYRRVLRNFIVASSILGFCLGVGIVGYHYTADIPWLDALHNASMILSGMGPVVTIDTVAGKIFSSCYAIFSGVVFITNVGFILAPMAHRFFHKLHLEED